MVKQETDIYTELKSKQIEKNLIRKIKECYNKKECEKLRHFLIITKMFNSSRDIVLDHFKNKKFSSEIKKNPVYKAIDVFFPDLEKDYFSKTKCSEKKVRKTPPSIKENFIIGRCFFSLTITLSKDNKKFFKISSNCNYSGLFCDEKWKYQYIPKEYYEGIMSKIQEFKDVEIAS